MMRFRNKTSRGSRGAAALELTLAMPLMLTLTCGMIEFGSAFNLKQKLVSAAGEAARVGSQASCPRATEEEVLAAARATLISMGLDPSLATFSFDNVGGESGSEMIVSVTYDALFPLLAKLGTLGSVSNDSVEVSVRLTTENE